MRVGRGLRATLLPVFGLLLTGGVGHAAIYTGNSAYTRAQDGSCQALLQDNGNFDDPKNWGGPCTPGAVPGPGTTADLTGRVIHGSTVNVGTLIVGGGGSLTADSITTNILKLSGGISGTSANSVVNINSSLDWTQGSFGSVTVNLGVKCATTISGDADSNGNGAKYINHGSVMNNRGTINWSGAGLLQYGAAPGTLNNYGTFKCVADGTIGSEQSGYGITINNSGTLTKISGSGTTRIGAGTGFVNNAGQLQAKTGILDPSSAYGTSIMNDGTTIAPGAGVVLDSFFWELHGTINLKGTLRLASSGNYGIATFAGPGLLDWRSGGFAADPAKTQITLAADSNCLMNGADNKVTGALTSLGTLRWKAGKIDGTLANKGTFNLLQDGDLGSPTLVNFGTIAKTGGTGEVTLGSHTLTSNGVIDIQKGTLTLGYGQFNHDTFNNGTLQGAGKIVSYCATNLSGNVTVNTTLQLDAPSRTGSELHGPANLVGTGIVNWQGGVMDRITLGKTITTNALSDTAKVFNGVNTNLGTFNWRGGAPINFGPNAGDNLTNSGTFNVLASGQFGSSTFLNKGTLNTFAGKTSYFGVLNNSGILNLGTSAVPGILNFTSNDSVGFTNSGTLNAFIATDKLGHFSQVLVSSNNATSAVLGGTLALKTASNANLTAASQLPLVSIGSRTTYSGSFATVSGLPAFSSRAFKLFYNPLDVTLGLPLGVSSYAYRVVNESLQGIPGATLTVTSATGASQTATTDANGYAIVNGLPAGTYTVAVTSPGITFDAATKKVAVPSTGLVGSPDNGAVFTTYAASAKVVDAAGAPVTGQEILISGGGVSRSVFTDASGIALFADLGPGTYTLTPSEQTDFNFSPLSGSVKLPTTGVAGSPNGQVTFVRKAKAIETGGIKPSAKSS